MEDDAPPERGHRGVIAMGFVFASREPSLALLAFQAVGPAVEPSAEVVGPAFVSY